MTREKLIELAREAGLQAIYSACDEPNIRYAYENWDDELEHFANLITKHILAKSYPELVSLAAKHAAETVAAAERNRTWTQDHWTEYERSIVATEREAIATEFMKRHEAVKHLNNYWHHAANYVRERGQDD